MADISAADVMKLRKMSGQGMMDCKKALKEAGGDIEQAMTILRKKGLATLAKRAERATSEGIVIASSSDDNKTAILASLCCETDFVAKSDDFINAAKKLEAYALACDAEDGAENLTNTAVDEKTFAEIITETVSKTGEKMEIGNYSKFTLTNKGVIGTYIHFNQKVGAMVLIEADKDCDELQTAAVDIAMHITAIKPIALDKDSIPAETIESEKAIYAEQIKGKPDHIVEKIVEGKINKFFAESCLVNQPFVKDDSKTVQEHVAEIAKKAGVQAKVAKFVRIAVSD